MKNNIQKYNFKDGLPQEFEILNMAKLYEEFSNDLTVPHRAEFYQILWFKNGNPTHIVDFIPVNITPNTILFINKNSVQQYDSNVDFDGEVILFTDAFFCKDKTDVHFLKSSILFNDLFTISKIHVPNISSLLTDFLTLINTELQNSKDEYQSAVLRNYLRNILLLSERERKKQDFIEIKKGVDLDYLLLFKELLENQFTQEKLVNSYANQMHITKKRLNIATSKIVGKTPKQLIDARIMLEAKRLLVHTFWTVKEISFNLGFDESTNFIKYFKKHQNTTPIEFRDTLLH